MPIPGLTDTYDFVDWLKKRKYHIAPGETVTIKGERGGLVTVTCGYGVTDGKERNNAGQTDSTQVRSDRSDSD